jgi:hypothetical protein
MPFLPELRERIRRFKLPNTRILLLGLLSFAAGMYVRKAPWLSEWKDVLGAACDALLIAAFLSLAVDPILKKELVTDAAKDIFWYAFGYSLPEEMRRFMNELMMRTKIVRRGCELNWEIAPKTGVTNKLDINLEASFNIVNFSDEDLVYQHKVFSWKENVDDVGCVKAIYCNCSDGKGTRYRKDSPETLEQDEEGFIAGEPIRLGRHSKPDMYRIGAVYYTDAELPGLDQFSIMEATTDIQVVVTVADSLAHLVFSVVPDLSGSRASENYRIPTRDPKTNRLQCSWKLDRVFVQNERVLIRWKHREIKVPEFGTVQ